MKRHFNKHVRTNPDWNVGDEVWLTPGEKWGHYLGSALAEVDPGFGLNSVRSQSQNVDELFRSMRVTRGQLMLK